ncbi:hypothetical protein [Neobacillus sp. LXY-4]|uniref:hypothetical protein n=1 Tax=Neobacillus sp. LXY-4 TaxID=3379826 RepID=UPI003EE2655A
MNILKAYTKPLLRNFEIQDLKPLLKNYVPDFGKKLNMISDGNGWSKIAAVLNEENNNGFNDNLIEKILYRWATEDIHDHIYLLKFDSSFNVNYLMSKVPSNYLNRHIAQTIKTEEKLISIRSEKNIISVLYRFGTCSLGLDRNDKCLFLVSAIINLEDKLLTIRLNKHNRTRSNFKLPTIINEIVSNLTNIFENDVSISRFQEGKLEEILYNIFNEESESVEKIIEKKNEKSEKQLENEINSFLKNQLLISDPSEYFDRVKYIYFQEIAKKLKAKDYRQGYIFGICFRDRQLINSTTRDPKKKSIYTSEFYWNLKGLIHKYKEVSDLSVYWRFNRDNFSDSSLQDQDKVLFVEVGLKVVHSVLEIHYYHTLKEERGIKEKYVIQRIKKYL